MLQQQTTGNLLGIYLIEQHKNAQFNPFLTSEHLFSTVSLEFPPVTPIPLNKT